MDPKNNGIGIFISLLVALLIGGVEALRLIGDHFKPQTSLGPATGILNDNFGALGFIVLAIFAVSWIALLVIYRLNRYNEPR